jgi:hypothetical protein
LCNAGTWSTTPGSTSSTQCISCNAGTWSSLLGATSSLTCIACRAGTFSNIGSTNKTQCDNCNAGTWSFAGTNCFLCNAGTWSSVVASTTFATCVDCEAATSSQSGSSSIFSCIPLNCASGDPCTHYAYSESTCLAVPGCGWCYGQCWSGSASGSAIAVSPMACQSTTTELAWAYGSSNTDPCNRHTSCAQCISISPCGWCDNQCWSGALGHAESSAPAECQFTGSPYFLFNLQQCEIEGNRSFTPTTPCAFCNSGYFITNNGTCSTPSSSSSTSIGATGIALISVGSIVGVLAVILGVYLYKRWSQKCLQAVQFQKLSTINWLNESQPTQLL